MADPVREPLSEEARLSRLLASRRVRVASPAEIGASLEHDSKRLRSFCSIQQILLLRQGSFLVHEHSAREPPLAYRLHASALRRFDDAGRQLDESSWNP